MNISARCRNWGHTQWLRYSSRMGGDMLKLWQNGLLGHPKLPDTGPTTTCYGLYTPKRQVDTGDKDLLSVTVNLDVCSTLTSRLKLVCYTRR